MNGIHNRICSSKRWAARVEGTLIPWGTGEVDLGEDVLEVGPGFGATTRCLAERPGRLTAIELDEGYCRRLRSELGEKITVVEGDATKLPFEDGRFSGVVCFTMLHHIPSRELQDRLFREVARVLQPGGWFAGTDSVGTGLRFKLIHIGDTLVTVDPAGLPGRLRQAGLVDPVVQRNEGSFRFRARRAPAREGLPGQSSTQASQEPSRDHQTSQVAR